MYRPFIRVISTLVVAFAFFPAVGNAAPQGRLLVLNKGENTLAIVDPAARALLGTVPTGASPHEVTASADGTTAYVANYGPGPEPGNTLSVIDLSGGKPPRTVDLGALRRPHGIVEGGGKIWLTCEVNRAVARYDPATDRVDWIMGTGQDATHMLAVAPDQKRIYTANIRSATVTVLDFTVQPSVITQIPVRPAPEGIDLRADGRELWVVHRNGGGLTILDTATRRADTLNVGGDPFRVRLTPDGTRAVITNPRDGEVLLLDVSSRRVVKRLALDGVPAGIAVAPDSRFAAVALLGAGAIALLDLSDLSLLGTVATGESPDGLWWTGTP